MSDVDKATILDYIAVTAARDWDRAEEYHGDGWQQRNPDGTVVDRAGYRDAIRPIFDAFPDLVPTIHDQVAEGGRVVTHLTWSGSHPGDFGGLAATGRPVAIEVIRIDRVIDGRITDTVVMFDGGAVGRQLGGG